MTDNTDIIYEEIEDEYVDDINNISNTSTTSTTSNNTDIIYEEIEDEYVDDIVNNISTMTISETRLTKVRMSHIYKIVNSVNDNVYIGQTAVERKHNGTYDPVGYGGRFREHLYEANARRIRNHFYNIINELGANKFSVELLEECPSTQANEREIFYIAQYNSFANGYNSTIGGGVRFKDNDNNHTQIKIQDDTKIYRKNFINTNAQNLYKIDIRYHAVTQLSGGPCIKLHVFVKHPIKDQNQFEFWINDRNITDVFHEVYAYLENIDKKKVFVNDTLITQITNINEYDFNKGDTINLSTIGTSRSKITAEEGYEKLKSVGDHVGVTEILLSWVLSKGKYNLLLKTKKGKGRAIDRLKFGENSDPKLAYAEAVKLTQMLGVQPKLMKQQLFNQLLKN